MTLKEHITLLPKDKQFDIAIRLIKQALPIWDEYVGETELSYRDSVVGLWHRVDKGLLKNTTDKVELYFSSAGIKKFIIKIIFLLPLYRRYREPIVALQDNDWELPSEVERLFFAVYNLLDATLERERTSFSEETIYVAINQAIDALSSSKTITDDGIREIVEKTK
jgi:hypothetical protein